MKTNLKKYFFNSVFFLKSIHISFFLDSVSVVTEESNSEVTASVEISAHRKITGDNEVHIAYRCA